MESRNVVLKANEAGIVAFIKALELKWIQMICEWIDNSLGAGAREIRLRRSGSYFEIEDDGRGCDDLVRMESLAESLILPGNKAGMFGLGGVMSQIKATQAGRVEVKSRTTNKFSYMVIDWSECLRQRSLFALDHQEEPIPAPDATRTGTVISLHNCMKFKDIDRLAFELGYRYAPILRRGRLISLDVNGKDIPVVAYKPPPFADRVRFDFPLGGHRIKGSCGLVKGHHKNPFPGWSVHWGYRFINQFHEPAGGRSTSRIHAEVFLPDSWKNINPTKDSFDDDPAELWEAIADRCRGIIDAAAAEAEVIELSGASRAVESIIGRALSGVKKSVKGRRPGVAGKVGVVEPTGNGRPHQRFTITQPGDRAGDGDGGPFPGKIPHRVCIHWDGDMEEVFAIRAVNFRGLTLNIYLNPRYPQVAEYRDDRSKLASYCLILVAHHLAKNIDNCQRFFPSFRDDDDFQKTYRRLLENVATSHSATV